jgi:NTE family protein
MASPAPKTINLALQGGGSHGAITWGVIDRLLEDDRIAIEAISGASAGAVNAAALAFGLFDGGPARARQTLNDLWRMIAEVGAFYSPVRRTPLEIAADDNSLEDSISYQFFDIFTRLYSPYQFNPFNINPLRGILHRCIDFDRLRQCTSTKLFLSATNVRTGKVHIFRTKDASIDAVLASACLPFLFRAVEIDGEAYWDGGYMGNPVLFPFIYEADAQDVVIVHVNPIERNEIPVTAPDILNRINEISFNSSLLRELRAIAFVQKLLEEGWIKEEHRHQLRKLRIHSIRSDDAVADLSVATKFNVDWRFLTTLRDRGRAIAEGWLQQNFDFLDEQSSVDIRMMFDS